MALPDLTGQNIENTYQRIVQTDGTNFYDGTGSLVILPSANTASLLTTASVVGNIITFTKGNTSQFSITVDTGSGGVIDTSSLVTTSSFNAFTSSINQFTSSYNTGSFSGSFIGQLIGTASWANNALTASLAPNYVLTSVTSSMLAPYVLSSQTSSFVTNAQTSSFVQNSQTSSFVQNSQTSSFVQNSQTSSFVQNSQTSSFVTNAQTSSMTVLSSSFALTASFALNGGGGTVDTSSLVTTASFNQFTSSYNTGSFSGSFIGTASWANNSTTASFASNISDQVINDLQFFNLFIA